MIKSLLKKVLLNIGYDVSRYDARRDPKAVLRSFFKKNGINVVLDVGANSGQYAHQLRRDGYDGRIVSFEPLSSAYKVLEGASKNDSRWDVRNCALGDKIEELEINIAGNSWSSSLLGMLPSHSQEAPESVYVDKEVVKVEVLDELFTEYTSPDENVFLKIDTQGYTKQVLDGANESIGKIKGVMLEMSLIPLYENEPLIADAIKMMYEKGFALVFIEPEFIKKDTGQQLQVNGFFFRL